MRCATGTFIAARVPGPIAPSGVRPWRSWKRLDRLLERGVVEVGVGGGVVPGVGYQVAA